MRHTAQGIIRTRNGLAWDRDVRVRVALPTTADAAYWLLPVDCGHPAEFLPPPVYTRALRHQMAPSLELLNGLLSPPCIPPPR